MTDVDDDVEVDEFSWFRSLSDEDQALYLELLEKVAGEQWSLAGKQRYAEAVWNKVDWLFYGGAAGGGKATALSTRVATPSGWTTIGQLSVGEEIFDERGHATRVVQLHPITSNQRSYVLRFDDGSEVEACAEHRWPTFDARELASLTRCDPAWRAARRAKRPSRATGTKSAAFTAALAERNRLSATSGAAPSGTVRTTQEIADTLCLKSGRRNHAIPVCAAIELPEADLLVDPYVLGAWLGDGSRHDGTIASHDDDQPEMRAQFEHAGYRTSNRAAPQTFGVLGLVGHLRQIGVHRNKHVPPAYLRGSIKQRLALLQGLMDTDGHACDSGAVEFTNTNKRLAEAVVELACSLGHKARMTEGRAMLDGRDCGPKYRIKWTPPDVVFRLDRKVAQQAVTVRRTTQFRYIVACDPIEPVPMRCITVDNPTGLFLVGDTFIPTHNSELALKHANDLSVNHPGHATLIVRQSIPELRRSIILRMVVRKAQYKLPAKLRKVDGVTQFRYDNTSFIECGYLATDENLGQYLSAEYGAIIVDEASLMTANQIVSLASRLRITKTAAKQGARTHLGLFSNPGGASHGWLRDIFVTPTDYGNRIVVYDISQGIENAQIARTYTAPVVIEGVSDETIDDVLIPWVAGLDLECDPETELAVAFVPAKATDNPHIDPSFMRGLNALPAKRRRQLRDGDFDVFDGMYFDEWSRDVHTCDPFDIPDGWQLARAADFGHAAPWCCLWGAWDNDGDLWIYREAYGAGMTPIEQARQAKTLSEQPRLDGWPRIETYWATVGDPSVFTNSRGTGKTIAQMWRENGFQVTKAKNARVAGWANVRQYLWDSEGERARLHVFNTCPNLIRTIPLMQRDKRNTEDLDSTLEDHAPDCLRYLAALRPIGTKPPPSKLGMTVDQRWSKLVASAGKRKRSNLFGSG